jgi:hypothetical protein
MTRSAENDVFHGIVLTTDEHGKARTKYQDEQKQMQPQKGARCAKRTGFIIILRILCFFAASLLFDSYP